MADDKMTCSNEDRLDGRPVAAIARLFWPNGRYLPVMACVTDLNWSVRNSLDEGLAVEVWCTASLTLRDHGHG